MSDSYKKFIEIKADTDYLEGTLEVPQDAIGLVAFAHDGDGKRLGSGDQYIAAQLRKARIGTLLLDLLTKQENRIEASRFNINLLTRRLNAVCHWLEKSHITSTLPLGLLGEGTGAAAVLQVAATHSKGIAAIVVRGGRPDLANQRALKSMKIPALFIVGSRDYDVLTMNRRVYFLLNCKKKLEIVSGATHLFEERGAMEKVAELATQWFVKHMQLPVFEHHFKKH